MKGDAEASIERAKRVINDPNKTKGATRKPQNKRGFKGSKISHSKGKKIK